jgi:hypothetical protein
MLVVLSVYARKQPEVQYDRVQIQEQKDNDKNVRWVEAVGTKLLEAKQQERWQGRLQRER